MNCVLTMLVRGGVPHQEVGASMASPSHYRLRTGQSNKRGTGWEALHIAIDDNSRLAYTEILRREEGEGHILPRAGARHFFQRRPSI
jgi:hypothetical protein